MLSWKVGLLAGAFAPLTGAILAATGSPCDSLCGNVLSGDSGDDITCSESAYTSTTVFEECINCQLTSTYSYNNFTDLQAMLYNLRYAISWCVWGYPSNPDVGDSPCITTFACGPLESSVEWSNLSTSTGAYDYCSGWISDSATRCEACLRPAGNGNYLANFFVLLDAACQQKPAVGSTLTIEGNPFSTVEVNITTATPTYASVAETNYGPVSLGARVGIAFGGLAFILMVAGVCIVLNGKRRRRRFLRELAKKNTDGGWPHPSNHYGGGGGPGPDMFETPVSQKPLRGWDESPTSAHTEGTERTLPRYFSPYASQYNSPVSASEGGPSVAAWPTLAPQNLAQQIYAEVPPPPPHPPVGPTGPSWPTSEQEKMQLQSSWDHQRRQQEIAIGIALGGDDASLRSKKSNQNLDQYTSDVKGKDKEAYEMHEVESRYSGGGGKKSHAAYKMPTEPGAPVLHHPGYGRHALSRTSSGRTGNEAPEGMI